MKEFISKWSNWWILNPNRKQLDEAFKKELNTIIEREVALRQPIVSGMLKCVSCGNTSTKDGLDCYGKCHICTQAF